MNKSLLAVLLCCTFQLMHGAGTRNAIFLFDWAKETVANDREFGPVTQSLLAALAQQAAPIIVSATTWRNAIERGKMFDDIVHKRDISYLQQYKMLQKSEDFQKFAQDIRKDYNAQRDQMKSNASLTAVEYYICYQTFYASNSVFKINEWIIKQLSDYLYLLIPKSYLQKLEASQDTVAIARRLTTKLKPQERVLGMKFSKFDDIAHNNLLDPQWHAGAFAYKSYIDLVPSSAFRMIEKLLNDKLRKYLKGYFFGQHVNHMLAQLFVTHFDLKAPGGDRDQTDVNEALFLHEWLVYMDGHGSLSDKGPVRPVIYTFQEGPWTKTSISIAYLAGLELGAFRELLSFLNNRVRTGAFVYTSCYSGGKHLFKLYEHQWDYPITVGAGRRARVKKYTLARQDVFNYLIIATNLWYKETQSSVFNYWSSGRYYQRLPGYQVRFDQFFTGLAAFLYPSSSKKVKDKIAQLQTIIKYVHSFNFKDRWQVPAIRFPYTEWFVALDWQQIRLRLHYMELDVELKKLEKEFKEKREKIENSKGLTYAEEEEKLAALYEKEEEREEELFKRYISYIGKKLVKQKKQELKEQKNRKKLLEAMLQAREEVPDIVQESIRLYEEAGMPPEKAEKLAREQEQRRIKEAERKEQELFERMEKMRKEQERREGKKPPMYREKKKPPKGGVPVFPFGPSKRKNDVPPKPGPKKPKKMKPGRRASMAPLQNALFKLTGSLRQLGKTLR